MKRVLLSVILMSCIGAGLLSCSKKGADAPTTPDPINPTPVVPDSVKVFLSTSTLENNGFDVVTITVKDKSGSDVTGTSQLYVDGVAIYENVYSPFAAKDFVITAKKGALRSNEAILKVVAPAASSFTQKLLVADFTGTWCQYCPRAARILESYTAAHPACISIGVHGGSSTEPFTYKYINNLADAFGIKSFPWAVVNHNSKWSEEAQDLDPELKKWAPLGLAIQSTVNGDKVTGKVQVKYGVNTGIPMKITIMLVEDGLVYPQVNAYSNPVGTPYYGPNPISNFVHTNVLRQVVSEDVVNGDDIPVSAQIKDNVWSKDFSFSQTGTTGIGTSYSVNFSKARIVAFVSYGANNLSRKGAINAQIATVGTTKNFD